MQKEIRAVILTASWFEDLEVLYPLYRLREARCHVDVAAPRKARIRGAHGYKLVPDLAIHEEQADAYDLLILPGGPSFAAARTVSRQSHARDITRAFMGAGKPVAAICHGPYTLVAADVVRGRHLTSYLGDGVPKLITRAGGIHEDTEVVVDGNLVTSRTPADLPAFMREVYKLLQP